MLGHIGARGTAFSNVTMLDAEFSFDEIRVTSRRPESREAFGAALEQSLGKSVRVVDSIEEAVRGADIVVEATRLIEPAPILRTEWIGPGALVVPYGTMSAVELSLTAAMDKIVVDDWQQCRQGRFGSLRPHVERGLLSEANLHGELGQIVAGKLSRTRARRRAHPVLAPRPGDDRPGRGRPAAPARRRSAGWARCCTTVEAVIVLERYDQLDLDEYRRIVREHEPLELAAGLERHVQDRRSAMERMLAGGVSAYGVTTGLGYLAARSIAADDRLALQRSILVGRAAAVGEPLPEEVVRGAMLLRLTGFLSGHAGVTPALCRFIADRLNDGWYPVVPASRPGTAGETIPLCHLFQTFIGEGEVLVAGERVAAATALARHGAAPYELQLKEGLALVNGAPLAPALAVSLADRAELLLEQATLLGAIAAALVGAPGRPYSARIGRLKGDPGQGRVHARLAELAAGEPPVEGPQAPVSLRVLPQVHGAAHDQLDHLHAQVAPRAARRHRQPALPCRRGRGAGGLLPERQLPLPGVVACPRRPRDCSRPGGGTRGEAAAPAARQPVLGAAGAALAPSRARRVRPSRAPQGGRRAIGREPDAGCPGVGARRRHLRGAGGLPGVHRARGRQAGAAARQPRARARLRACGACAKLAS